MKTVRMLAALGLAVTLAAGLAGAQQVPAPQRIEEERAARWREDLAYLARELPARHVNLFFRLSESDFRRAVTRLEADIPGLEDHQIIVRMMELAAAAGDAHTAVGGARAGFATYPLTFGWFADGIFVSRAPPEHAAAVQARLVAVDGMPVEEAVARLRRVIARENDSWLRARLPLYLRMAEVLEALGIARQRARATFTVETPGGERISLELATAPDDWLGASQAPPGPLPYYRRDRGVPYWHEWDAERGLLYIAYNACVDLPARPFAAFAAEVYRILDEQKPRRVVVDLRNNSGGDSSVLDPFIERLARTRHVNRRGVLFVLIGPATFSSAMLNAHRFTRRTRALLAGEPTGGRPNGYGEVRSFTLPHSGLTVWYSTRAFRLVRGAGPDALEPHLRVERTAADFFGGRDPVLDAVLAFQP